MMTWANLAIAYANIYLSDETESDLDLEASDDAIIFSTPDQRADFSNKAMALLNNLVNPSRPAMVNVDPKLISKQFIEAAFITIWNKNNLEGLFFLSVMLWVCSENPKAHTMLLSLFAQATTQFPHLNLLRAACCNEPKFINKILSREPDDDHRQRMVEKALDILTHKPTSSDPAVANSPAFNLLRPLLPNDLRMNSSRAPESTHTANATISSSISEQRQAEDNHQASCFSGLFFWRKNTHITPTTTNHNNNARSNREYKI